ncbi:MAG: Dynein light chain 4, axonemal [Marteilia pararefringens]
MAQNESLAVGEELRSQFNYPLVVKSELGDDIQSDIMDMCVAICEKGTSNYESACRNIKENLDKKYGSSWLVVMGEGYGYEISYDDSAFFSFVIGGNLCLMIWKCT